MLLPSILYPGEIKTDIFLKDTFIINYSQYPTFQLAQASIIKIIDEDFVILSYKEKLFSPKNRKNSFLK